MKNKVLFSMKAMLAYIWSAVQQSESCHIHALCQTDIHTSHWGHQRPQWECYL